MTIDKRALPTNLERRGDKLYFRGMIGGKLYRKSTGFRDLTRAKRRANEIEGEIRAGKLGWEKKSMPTFGMWIARFLKAYYPGKQFEADSLKRALAKWETRPLNLITSSDAQEYFRGREADKAAEATMAREHMLLKRAFKAAIADKVTDTNPFVGVRKFKCAVGTRVLSAGEETQLRGILSPKWDRYLTVALGTGLRAGELRAIRPMDLRKNATFVWVPPESNKLKKGREVPLSQGVQQALREQAESRDGDETTPYFPLSKATAMNLFKRKSARLKFKEPVTPHDFRRTFGTRAAEAGMWPKHLQMILGHENINMTMRHYVSLEQASLLDALVKAGL